MQDNHRERIADDGVDSTNVWIGTITMSYVVALLIFGVLLSICVAGYTASVRDAERFSHDRKPSSSPSKPPSNSPQSAERRS